MARVHGARVARGAYDRGTMAGSLIVYTATARGDDALREAVRAGGRLTVVALAPVESSHRRCCDTRSTYWNGVQRELASSELARARLVVEGVDDVSLEVLGFDVMRPVESILRRAGAIGAERVVLADPRRSRLGRRAVRRLRRHVAPVAA
jgi:hypothetical protein